MGAKSQMTGSFFPGDWDELPLSETLDFCSGSIDPRRYPDETFELYSMPAYDTKKEPEIVKGTEVGSSKKQVFEGDVLFARLNPRIPRVWVVREGNAGMRKLASTDFLVLTDKKRPNGEPWFESSFLRYQLLSSVFRTQVAHQVQGATGSRQRISLDTVSAARLGVPSLETQRRIIARIEALFAELRAARELHETIVEDTDRLMDAVLADVFSDVVKEYPPLPLASYKPFITSGPRHWARYAHAGGSGSLFLRVGNIGFAELNLDDIQQLDLPENAGEDRAIVQPDDVLITITGTIGRCCVVPTDLPKGYINQHVALVRLGGAHLLPRYLMWYVLSPAGSGQTNKMAYGQTKPGLNLTQIRQLHLPVPDLADQHRIVQYLDTMKSETEQIRRNQEQDERLLLQVEKTILAQTFRGEL